MAFKFGIIGCGSVAIDHATIIKKLGHKIVLGITKSNKSKNWKLFKKIFPETKFANKSAVAMYIIMMSMMFYMYAVLFSFFLFDINLNLV